jgi:predicted nucleic acid-binding protein
VNRLKSLIAQGKVVGPKVPDGRVAAICLHHGVSELWSADPDFSRYAQLAVRNPL